MSTAAAITRSESLVDGEFPFTTADFNAIAGVLYETSGIHLHDSKAALVYSRLAKRLRLLGLRSFKDYVKLVRSSEGREERERLLMALTTNVTRFYREPHHFDHLVRDVFMPMADKVKAGAPLRLWSSACSTGQEPYSLALAVLSVWPNPADLDIKILATDIDANVVQTAKAGTYTAEAIEEIPAALRNRWLTKDPVAARTWRMNAEPRSLITFNTLNLIGQWPMKKKFDVIFCRNVVIYFDEQTQAKLWQRFRNQLTPQGRLYVGHSERVGDPAFESDGQTVYRLAGAKT